MLAIPRTSINSPGGQGNNMNYYNTGKEKSLLSPIASPLELASWTTIEWQGPCFLLYHWIACVLSGRRPGRDGINYPYAPRHPLDRRAC